MYIFFFRKLNCNLQTQAESLRNNSALGLIPFGVFQKQPSEVFCKKRCSEELRKIYGKNLCQSLFFNKFAGLRAATLLKETLAQVFSCEFCEISKNNFFTEHLRATASGFCVAGLAIDRPCFKNLKKLKES